MCLSLWCLAWFCEGVIEHRVKRKLFNSNWFNEPTWEGTNHWILIGHIDSAKKIQHCRNLLCDAMAHDGHFGEKIKGSEIATSVIEEFIRAKKEKENWMQEKTCDCFNCWFCVFVVIATLKNCGPVHCQSCFKLMDFIVHGFSPAQCHPCFESCNVSLQVRCSPRRKNSHCCCKKWSLSG